MNSGLDIFSLAGKTVLITGASSGIGKGIALACAKAGATVAAIGRNQARLDALEQELKTIGGSRHFVAAFDVTDFEGLPRLVESVVDHCGKIHGFVHSAGVLTNSPLKVSSAETYRKTFEINTIAAFELSRLLSLKKYCGENASFVFIASVSALKGEPGLAAYSASKGALIAGSRSLAAELAAKKIRVNCILPGQISNTEIGKYQETMLDAESYQRLAAAHPLGLGKVENMTGPAVFLLSDASSWMTGSSLVVDGGYTL